MAPENRKEMVDAFGGVMLQWSRSRLAPENSCLASLGIASLDEGSGERFIDAGNLNAVHSLRTAFFSPNLSIFKDLAPLRAGAAFWTAPHHSRAGGGPPSHHDSGPLDGTERSADTLHLDGDILGRPDVDDDYVILGRVHQVGQGIVIRRRFCRLSRHCG